MKFPCEALANKVLPAIRAEIAIKLFNDYGMKQIEISRILGVTQGAVSHYLTSFRGKERHTFHTILEIDEALNDITNMLVNGKVDENNFCTICHKLRKLISLDF
jgi:predicted transcriptional regulator